MTLLTGTGTHLGPSVLRYPAHERTLLRLLAQRAADTPDRPWLIFDSAQTLTYGEAWAQACRVGHALDRDGHPAGTHVGLLLANQPAFMPAFYGPQVRGGVTVPLNADSRGDALARVIAHSEVAVLVVRADLLERVEELEGLAAVRRIVVVGDRPGGLPERVGDATVVAWEAWLGDVRADHAWPLPSHAAPCLIQYTSGTTKAQKGALYSHHYLYLASAGCTDSQGHTPDDVLTTPMPMYHVAALHIVANAALQAGCRAHMKSKFSASRFWTQCAADGSTWAIVLGPMLAMIDKRTEDPVPEHRLRRIFCPPPPTNRAELEARFGVQIIIQGFGMTEIYPMPMVGDEPGDDVPLDCIGMPPSWVDYGIVDATDQLVAPGELGELVFRPRLPHAMMTEYFRNPEQTLHACRNLMFHTGDIGYYDERLRLHYVGRTQDRVRVRGEMVSAAELEYLALRHPDVLEAAAFGVPSPLGEEDLKLDVRTTGDFDAPALHAWLLEEAPRYMVPRYIELRAGFPKTPSERIEKYKLKADALDRPSVFDAEAARS